MKKLKQITALVGVILLVALYVSTLVLALMGGEKALTLLRAAIYCTIIVPVLLWAYSFIFRLVKKNISEKNAYNAQREMSDESEKTDESEDTDRSENSDSSKDADGSKDADRSEDTDASAVADKAGDRPDSK